MLNTRLSALRNHGVQLLNQSVLLKGINDSLTEQVALQEAVFRIGVLPYYLHQLDPVQGAAHFAVEDETAMRLYQQ
ncbi:MAG: EF-P beta-lysylation protein EpmB, partial [Halomonas sp. BM-2019]